MKEIIKKSLVGGLVFSLTSLAVFLVYAATYNLPAKVGTGSGLTATEWNKMVDSIDYLKTTTDGQQTSINTINTKLTAENWIAPTLLNGWVNYGTTTNTVGYYKDPNGIVRLKGLIKNGTAGAIFILPAGYRPIGQYIFEVSAYNSTYIVGGRVDVKTDGTIFGQNYGTGFTSLDGISFRAEQ